MFYDAVDGVCPLQNAQWPIFFPSNPFNTYGVNLTVTPAASSGESQLKKDYLFAIPAGTDLVNLRVGGIGGVDTVIVNTSFIQLNVYSRVHGTVKKLSQLISYAGDTRPKPDPDDTYFAQPTGNGEWQADVELDKDPADKQEDDYGKIYSPYKVTLLPPIPGSSDQIPHQPPPSLGRLK
jgi:hypothetical protein